MPVSELETFSMPFREMCASRMKLRVECYSGRKADERPVRFQLGERDYFIEEVLGCWYEPEYVFFKVRADDGNNYTLRHETAVPDENWELVP